MTWRTVFLCAMACARGASADAVDDVLSSRCALDPRLGAAALDVLSARDPGRPLDAARLRTLAENAGIPAPAVLAVLVRGETPAARAEALRAWFDARPAPHATARCAARTEGDHTGVALAPRLAEVTPVIARIAVGATLRQSVALPSDARDATLVVRRPDGQVRTQPLIAGGLSMRLESPGEHTLQVMADRGQGPLAWATWHVRAGDAGAAEAVSDDIASPRALVAAINAMRREAGAPGLRADPLLAAVAARYARALAQRAVIGHGVGEGDSPWTRLRDAHLHAERVAENVVRARTLTEAHVRLSNSPSHRANLLDPTLDAVGVGAFEATDGVYVVELFAARPAMGER